ncbi:hypothetical protein OG787_19420 [Streptomyces sp. NBC_00075]|uniref:hypothetical protein n=1 Tax=Streptomyces sp. NBC_00075 TaxID=2975641 RepID=UPI00325617CB
MYTYVTVRSDCRYGESVPARVLVEYLDSAPELRRIDLAFYEAVDGVGWLHVVMADCDSDGNYAAHKGRMPQRVNVVELVCSDADGPRTREIARELAARIADVLGWEVADPEADE